jgi:hypothetical protein
MNFLKLKIYGNRSLAPRTAHIRNSVGLDPENDEEHRKQLSEASIKRLPVVKTAG